MTDGSCWLPSEAEVGAVECFEALRLVSATPDTRELETALEATFESSVNPDSSTLLTTDDFGFDAASDEVLLERTLLGARESGLDVEDAATLSG